MPLELPSIGINISMKLLEIIESPLMGLTPPSIGGHLAGGYLQPDTIEGEESVLDKPGWPGQPKRFIVFVRSNDFEDVLDRDISRNEALHSAQEAVKKMVLNHPGEEAIVNRKDDTWTVQFPSSDYTTRVSIEQMRDGSVY